MIVVSSPRLHREDALFSFSFVCNRTALLGRHGSAYLARGNSRSSRYLMEGAFDHFKFLLTRVVNA